jgi:dihydrofolate reductase
MTRATMKTQYYTAASLDGFIATEDHSLEWLFPLGDINETSYPEFIQDVGALAMGASTYEWMLQHVVKPESDTPGEWPYTQPVWVFTHRRLPTVPGAVIHLVQGDVTAVHQQMHAAAGGKHLWIVGGGDLVGQFYDAGLLDEIIVQVGSVTLGAGQPLLPRRITTPPLQLTSARTMGSGFAELRYTVPARAQAER